MAASLGGASPQAASQPSSAAPGEGAVTAALLPPPGADTDDTKLLGRRQRTRWGPDDERSISPVWPLVATEEQLQEKGKEREAAAPLAPAAAPVTGPQLSEGSAFVDVPYNIKRGVLSPFTFRV